VFDRFLTDFEARLGLRGSIAWVRAHCPRRPVYLLPTNYVAKVYVPLDCLTTTCGAPLTTGGRLPWSPGLATTRCIVTRTCGCAVLLESAASTLPTYEYIQGPLCLWVVGRLGRLEHSGTRGPRCVRWPGAWHSSARHTCGGCHRAGNPDRAGNPEDDRAQSHRSTRVGVVK